MQRLALDVIVTRGDVIESRHTVHAAVVDAHGAVLAATAEPSLSAVWRSCAKPFQVMPFLASGEFERLQWGPAQLALACASHGGEPEHVEIVRAMLAAIGREAGDLACGAHEPLTQRGARLLAQSGKLPTRLHNNCSGKHAAMLAMCLAAGWPALGYERAIHPMQQRALETVALWAALPAGAIGRVIDGCGVVAFALPLLAMARAYAALGAAAERGEEIPARIIGAMRAHPFLIGGSERFDSVLIEETKGAVISKVGAEGVHSVTVPSAGIGLAVKVTDGASRAQHPAVLRLLQRLGHLPEALPPRLADFLVAPIHNTRGDRVGEVRPVD